MSLKVINAGRVSNEGPFVDLSLTNYSLKYHSVVEFSVIII